MRSRADIRQELRRRRAALAPSYRARSAAAIARHALGTGWLRPGRSIGLYCSVGSEVDTGPLRRLAARAGCAVYLPRIISYDAHHMVFQCDRGRYRPNRMAIPEPVRGAACPPRRLDVVFMPLSGFNPAGHRLGTGGGYYDRLFAFRRHAALRRPLLVGIAYDCQRSADFLPQVHDVPLDLLITESGILDWRRSRGSQA
ncbi:MAG: 5-formyltetrahydrofolate cyclo-ligase [Gammaproteobacteria bacterium]|nr:5-formyltetrahydrofolate cyclo-ligase [Gammaproteobacteria bacterium]